MAARKTVTVIFSDIANSTPLGEALDAEVLRGVMEQYYAVVRRELERHGGTVEKFIGDAVMAVFGAPIAMPDAAMAAVRSALEMNAAIREIAVETGEDLHITVGINSGPMVAGSIGSSKRLEFTVLGDTVNVASRLQGLAERDQIIIGQATADALDHSLVELAPIAPLKVKNR